MKSEDKKNISEAIKNIVISIAVIIGGGWTLYSFYTKYETEIAQLRFIDLQQKIVQRPIIEGDINTVIIHNKINQKRIIRVVVSLKNTGKMDVRINFGPSSISIAKVNFKHGKLSYYSNIINSHFKLISKTGKPFSSAAQVTLFSGQEKNPEAIFEVKEKGTYLVQLLANASESIVKARKEAGILANPKAKEVVLLWKYVDIM